MKGHQPKFIKQYASAVLDFSSQYGGENPRSVSYSIGNIIGEPKIFPAYGDFTQAAVFRTYGDWWCVDKDCRAKKVDARPKSLNFHGKDYIDLLYNEAVYPRSIAIYETYNPGAVVRILALTQAFPPANSAKEKLVIPLPFSTDCSQWEVLWECESPEKNAPNLNSESRMFAPLLQEIKHPTRIIRLEFCSTHLEYYTELDAVELTGTVSYCPSTSVDPPAFLLDRLKLSHTNARINNDSEHLEKDNTYKECVPKENTAPHGGNGYFDLLPPELLSYIFSFLPLTDLCRCAIVCKLFHNLSYDPSQFTNIDLSECWHLVNDNALLSIVCHCNPSPKDAMKDHASVNSKLRVADLSWCGGGGIVSSNSMVHLVENCSSSSLTHLILASSPAVSDELLKKIAHLCPGLWHLDIQSCDRPSAEGLRVLHNLKKLHTVNLYRTKVDDAGIICIVHSNPLIKSINLGSCSNILDYDRVALELAQHCPKLSSVDFWRAKSLTSMGLNALCRSCISIEELDLGWCGGLQSRSGCFEALASHCPRLRKLYVTANRTVSDVEINALAANCFKLEKLDILGTRLVTVSSISKLLQNCVHLRFLDVSFCFAFTKDVVDSIKEQYPSVSVKRSFVNER